MSTLSYVSEFALSTSSIGAGFATGFTCSLFSALVGAYIGDGIGSGLGGCIDQCLFRTHDQSSRGQAVRVQKTAEHVFGSLGSISGGMILGSFVISHVASGSDVPYTMSVLISSVPLIILTSIAYTFDKHVS